MGVTKRVYMRVQRRMNSVDLEEGHFLVEGANGTPALLLLQQHICRHEDTRCTLLEPNPF